MVTLTSEAAALLKQMQDENSEERPVRIFQEGDQFALKFDEEREGDEVVREDGGALFVVSQDVQETLGGLTLDCKNTPDGLRFTLEEGEGAGEPKTD